jgi:hypothetical protein
MFWNLKWIDLECEYSLTLAFCILYVYGWSFLLLIYSQSCMRKWTAIIQTMQSVTPHIIKLVKKIHSFKLWWFQRICHSINGYKVIICFGYILQVNEDYLLPENKQNYALPRGKPYSYFKYMTVDLISGTK